MEFSRFAKTFVHAVCRDLRTINFATLHWLVFFFLFSARIPVSQRVHWQHADGGQYSQSADVGGSRSTVSNRLTDVQMQKFWNLRAM
jgi:hypothetical protein